MPDRTNNQHAPLPEETKVSPAATPRPHGIVDTIGAWANKHRDFFRSTPGDLMFRNALNSMVAWVPTITSFVLTRKAWESYEDYATKNKNGLLTKIGKPLLGKEYPLGRMTGFIFGGWFTYRASYKLWNRAYDRLFAAKTPEDAADVVRAMPGNAFKDAKEIIPGGLAEIVPGAPALAIIPVAFLNQNTWRIRRGDFKQAKAGWLNNILSTGVAYSAFLEICDHIYPKVTHGKDYGDYYDRLKGLPPKDSLPDYEKKFGFFTNDGVGRMLFRTVPSVMLGFAAYFNPHFGGQRWAYAKFGMPTEFGKTTGEIAKNWTKDYIAWAPSFTMYTVLSQVYKENYDKLFDRLEKKAAHMPATHAERVTESKEASIAAAR